jgi:hypothetical protein
MKNLLIIAVLMITLTANAQARIGRKADNIFFEFEEQGIKYEKDDESFFLFYFINDNLSVQYFFDKDSICDRVLIQTFNQEMTDLVIDTYKARDYLKIYDGWLARTNGIIYKIAHKVQEDNTNLFLWY